MRARISITLPQKLLKAVDQRAERQGTTRSEFIAAAIRAFTGRLTRAEQNTRDLEIINGRADFLNREARDLREYQVLP